MNGNLVNNFFLRAKAMMTNVNMEKCESEKEKNLTPCDSLVQQRELTFVFVLHARETWSHAGFRLAIKASANLIFPAKIVSIVVTPLERRLVSLKQRIKN